ncbi:FtsX-like permease family protein, partial [bacterium]|nr:FtsX-like permease family protein [bacterium]
ADAVAAEIDKMFGYPYHTVTWFEMNKNLFAWMKIEKWGAFIILSLIIMVAAFNIVSTLIMIVLEKTKEIGILKSMGATSSGVMKIFMFEGLIGGLIGTILGCIIGYGLCWSQMKYQYFSLPADIYIISALPILMKETDFIMIAFAAVFLCFVATVYPANRAAHLDPVEAIRYE